MRRIILAIGAFLVGVSAFALTQPAHAAPAAPKVANTITWTWYGPYYLNFPNGNLFTYEYQIASDGTQRRMTKFRWATSNYFKSSITLAQLSSSCGANWGAGFVSTGWDTTSEIDLPSPSREFSTTEMPNRSNAYSMFLYIHANESGHELVACSKRI